MSDTTVGGLEIEHLKSIIISGPQSDSAIFFFRSFVCPSFKLAENCSLIGWLITRQQLISRTGPAAAFPWGRPSPWSSLKSNSSSPQNDSALIFFSVAPCVPHLNLLKIAA